MKKILIVLLACIISACVYEDRVYMAHFPDFDEKVKEYKVSPDEASKIYADYKFKKTNKDTVYTRLYVILKDHYVFCDGFPFNLKTQLLYVSGIWVNANTGKLKKVGGDRYVRISHIGIPIPQPLTKQFIRGKERDNIENKESTI